MEVGGWVQVSLGKQLLENRLKIALYSTDIFLVACVFCLYKKYIMYTLLKVIIMIVLPCQ